MALRRVRARRRASITSLIDVIFLLLLFFMLASTFSKFSEIELTSVPGAAHTKSDSTDVFRLRIEVSGISLNDEVLPIEEIARRLSVQSHIKKTRLAVSASDRVTTQQLTEVLLHLGSLPGLTIEVMEPV